MKRAQRIEVVLMSLGGSVVMAEQEKTWIDPTPRRWRVGFVVPEGVDGTKERRRKARSKGHRRSGFR